ncbi:high affinity nitrate transporter 2.7 [Salvia miltiorrhiza]|uniref:high affinity nitrate transporter 2.7 n=1 Tax=Salvia miltiorrhiza TaxID=226208 RepID=UPI0025AD56FB|nr:high affinity nitrate transporter 2.7 [Salvia miltiorrhiza]
MDLPSKTTAAFPYPLPVDSLHRATQFRPFSLSGPHMRAFHLAWLSLFSCFFSTFAVPPLLPAIRRDVLLSDADVGSAGIAAFAGSILSRLAMGPACDLFGPRAASAAISLVTAPAVLSLAFVSSPAAFIAARFFIGFSLANFVACQFWMSSMFSGNVVGVANGVSAGWANVGSGLTQLIMPLIYSFLTATAKISSSTAWRAAFVVPAALQVATALMVLAFGQDLPHGKYRRKQKSDSSGNSLMSVLFNGLKNYRGWILGLTYGFCFGVELTTDNIIDEYFYERFGVDMAAAGAIAASFGLANVVSRPAGGVASDAMGRRFGMRGRLWSLWAVMTAAGLLCFWLGRVATLWGSVMVMCCFSFFVQAASGLTFGVVPFVSTRYLGVISGMTGSGGTMGAVFTQYLLFSGTKRISTETGISVMGLMMIVCALPITLLYFPESGGMLCGPNSSQIQSYDDDQYQNLLPSTTT